MSITLHIFNPDTDYALASGSTFYTPPAKIKAMRASMALLPARWARPGEAILLLDDPSVPVETLRDYETAVNKCLTIVTPHSQTHARTGEAASAHFREFKPVPWGWNPALRHYLAEIGIPEEKMPSVSDVATIRLLSHRRTASQINTLLGSPHIAAELKSLEEVEAFTARNPRAWLKAPWSSSGRGVINCADLEPRHIIPWARGIIRRQGSVMAETPADRILDFATEWTCHDGMADFEGFSVFSTSSRGKYHGNLELPQSELEKVIKNAVPAWDSEIIERQKEALEAIVAGHYSGPAGIDMIAERDGSLRPCIELNLRMTMGFATLLTNRPPK